MSDSFEFQMGGKLELKFTLYLSSDLILPTVLNGLSLNTQICHLPSVTVSNGG